MSEQDQATPQGRPGAGAEVVQGLSEAAARRAKSRNVKALSRLLPFMAQHKGDAAWALVFLLLSTAATLGLSATVRLLTEHLTGPQGAHATPATINPWFLLIGANAVVLALASALRYFYVTKLGERIVADLRTALYGHILTLDPGFFLKLRTGEVLSRVTTDVQIVENLLSTSVSVALRNLLTLIGALAVLMVVSPKLTGLVLLLFPVVLAPLFLFGRKVRKLTTDSQDKFAHAVGYAGETLDALETVQAFGREATAARLAG